MFGVFDIAVGWAWHTAYRARRFWKIKREGALFAAAAVLAVGIADVIRSDLASRTMPLQTSHIVMTEPASPVVTETEVIEKIAPPTGAPVETIAAAESPALPEGAETSKLYVEPIVTGALGAKPLKNKAVKPAKKPLPN